MKKTRASFRAIALVFLSLAPVPVQAQLDKLKLAEHIQQVKFGGDLRLRNDRSHKRGANQVLRNRNRFRLRFGADLTLPNDLTANLRLGSGTGEQVSTNQSMDNLSSQKSLWIDTVYLKWAPRVSEDGSVHVTAGRMINPLWRVYSSDLLFDDDFNPEGLAEGVEWLTPLGVTVFANALQAVADEDSNSGKNQWLFSQQLGAETRLPFETRLRLGAALHRWSDVNRSTLSPAVANDGNRRTAAGTSGILLNRFSVAEITGQLSGWAGQTPLALQATLARNYAARQDLGSVAAACPAGNTCPLARDGYQYGLIVGSAKTAGSWEAAFFQKYSQTDVTVADVADSDFGDGGTNGQGQILWAAYAPTDWMQVKAKFLNTDAVDTQFAPNDKAVKRLQLDLSVKF
jgi:hypothetical protein